MSSAFAATRWVLFGSIGFRIVALAGQWAILRLVDKDTFGAYRAIVSVHLMLAALLPFGIDMLLVREAKIRKRYAVALSIVLGLMGAFFAAVSVVFAVLPSFGEASWGARILQLEGDATGLLVMAPIFAVMATKLAMRAQLTAVLDFRRISIGEFGNGLITWFGGAGAVLLYNNTAALLVAYLAGEFFETWWMYRGRPFRPFALLSPKRWGLMKRIVKRHQSFCLFNAADLTMNNVAAMLPGILLVAWVSREANADFQVASTLVILPVMLLVGAVHRVTFPSISGLSESELHRRCLAIIGATAAFVAPLVVWLAFFAPTTVWLLGGSKYLSAAPLVTAMSMYMIFVGIFAPISSLDVIRDRPELGLYWNIAYLIARVSVLWFFAGRGVVTAVFAMSIASCLLWVVWAGMLGWLLRAGMRVYATRVLKFAPLWAALALAFWGIVHMTEGRMILGPLFSILPAAIYLAVLLKFFPDDASMLRRMMR